MITSCPSCGSVYRNVPEHVIGKKMTCKNCETLFEIRPQEEQLAELKTSVREWEINDVILNLYTVKKLLGQGGFGKVYLVHHKTWDIDLAVKTPNKKAIEAAGGVGNFEREAEAWVNLGLHPHTVSCYYVRRIDGIPRVFAEYVSEGDLHDWIRSRRLYEGGVEKSLARIIDIAIQFAWGLHYAHEQKLIHQDVKPANLLLTEDAQAKVTDFGLARARALPDIGGGAGQTMVVKGMGYTPEYASPEQIAGEKLSRRTDIWSWAVSVLEMFCGERTWRSGSIAGFHLDEYLKNGPPDSDIPVMPELIAELLKLCFREDPKKRPHDLQLISDKLIEIYRRETGKPYDRTQSSAGRETADNLNNRAISLLDLGRQDEAVEAWDKALSIQPYHSESTYNRGLALWRNGDGDDEALVEQMEKVLQVAQLAWLSRYLLSQVHLQRGDCEAAIEVLTPIKEYKDSHIDVAELIQFATDNIEKSRRVSATIKTEWPVNSVAVDSKGDWLLSGGQDRTLGLWNVHTKKCEKSLTGHASAITAVAISADGKTALSGSQRNEVKHWDLLTGKCLRTFKDHKGAVTCVYLTDDGKYLISAGDDQTIRMWSADTHTFIRKFLGHSGDVTSIAVDSKKDLLLSGSADQTARLWKLSTGECLQTFKGHSNKVSGVGFIGSDNKIISVGLDQSLRIWGMKSGDCLRVIGGHTAPITALSTCRDGNYFLSGSNNGRLKIWDSQKVECLCTFNNAHTQSITDTATRVSHGASCSVDKSIRIWSLERTYDFSAPIVLSKISSSESVLSTQVEYEEEVEAARKAIKSGHAVVAMQHIRKARMLPGYTSGTEAMTVWRQLYGYMQQVKLNSVWRAGTSNDHHGQVNSVCLSSDGTYALSGSDDATMKLWGMDSGECVKTFLGHTGAVTSVLFSACGRYVISASKDHTIKLWDIEQAECEQTFSDHTDCVNTILLSPNGRYLASGSKDCSIKIWDIVKGVCMQTLTGHQQAVNCCLFQDDWRFLLSGSSDKTLRQWDITTGESLKTIGTFGGHSEDITDIGSSYDGRLIITSSKDGTLKQWDLDSGNCIKTVDAHQGAVTSVSISLDGMHALTAGEDGHLNFWNLKTGEKQGVMVSEKRQFTSACLAADKGQAVSADNEGVMYFWAFDWELMELSGRNDKDKRLLRYFDAFINRQLSYSIARIGKKKSAGSKTTQTAMHSGSSNWDTSDIINFQKILGYAGWGEFETRKLNAHLHDHYKEMKASAEKQADADRLSQSTITGKHNPLTSTLSGRVPVKPKPGPGILSVIVGKIVTALVLVALGYGGYYFYHYAIEYVALEDVRTYVGKGGNVNQITEKGQMPIHIAARKGHVKVVNYLLKHGSRINARDNLRLTPLHHAVIENNAEMVALLLDNNARLDVRAGSSNKTPLSIASKNDNKEIIRLLSRGR